MFRQLFFHLKQALFCLFSLLLLVCFAGGAKAGQSGTLASGGDNIQQLDSFANNFQAQNSFNVNSATSQTPKTPQSGQTGQSGQSGQPAQAAQPAQAPQAPQAGLSSDFLPDPNNNSTGQDYNQQTPGDIEQSFILNRFYLSGNDSLLTARLNLSATNIQYLRDILRDGARLSLQCHTAFYRKRSILKNVLIDEHSFSASLRYNPLQREFLVYSENRPPLINVNLTELLQQTWGNLELPLVKYSELEKGETYVAILTLALRHEEMPPWLGKNVFFWSDVVIAPKEYKLEFEY